MDRIIHMPWINEDFIITDDKWHGIYEDYGIKRKNGYISTAERNKARKKHKKK